MNNERPFIHLFYTKGGYYIFDVNTNAIIKVEKKEYNLLEDLLNKNTLLNNDFIYEEYKENAKIISLKEKGYLSSKKTKEIIHPISDILEYYLSSKIKMIILQVTQQCNLRCEYCAYSGSYINRKHKNVRMSFETAKKGIDFLIDNSKDIDEVNVGFYGGEPLLEFELVKKAILYAEEVAEGKKITFSFTTNGTLFTKEVIEFLMKHDVSITISLDGPKEVHDMNRKFAVSGCGTFEKITDNLEFFKNNYPEYFKKILFNAVIDYKSSFSCLSEFFTSYDVLKDSYLITSEVSDEYSLEQRNRNEDYDVQLSYEMFKMYLAKLNRIDNKNVSKLVTSYFDNLRKKMITDRLRKESVNDKGHHGGPCVPGAQRLFMDVDGNLFPCERVSEESDVMRIGHINNGFDYNKIRNLLNIGKITEANCIDCWAFDYCSLCATFADELDELSAKKKLSYCQSVRYSLEDQLKDYCMLNEFGCSFDDSNILRVVEV
ncbi:UNVERIFIED_CONTAM: uncharacterized protein Cloal_1474 [Acetivibrio alkalicellulosi]